jgi:hypothetical protein
MSQAADDKSRLDQDMTKTQHQHWLPLKYMSFRRNMSLTASESKVSLVSKRNSFHHVRPHLSVSDLIGAIDIVYDGAPDNTNGICKGVA